MKQRRTSPLKPSAILLGAGLVALYAAPAQAIEPFTDASNTLSNSDVRSGVSMGVADMNGDGLDDIVRLHQAQSLEIEYQQADGSFERTEIGGLGINSWSVAIADVDGNGYNDIFTGGAFDSLVVMLANDNGTGFTQTTLTGPNGNGTFVQCSSFSDIDNDGHLDLFVCHDVGKSRVFQNDGSGGLQHSLAALDPASTVPSDGSGNYGNVWTDFDGDGDSDLYISKCRQQNNNLNSGERLNLLFERTDAGYVEVAESVGLLPRGQTWASDFADIDNDGDMDAIVLNHRYGNGNPQDAPSFLYENVEGSFVDITEAAGIRTELDTVGLGIQTYFGDFDNDGNVDLLLTSGGGSPTEGHKLLVNNGDGTFTNDDAAFPLPANLRMQSLAVGDLNDDGNLDLVGGFASGFNTPTGNPDRLLLGGGNDNHWFKIRLVGTQSNRAAIGAIVKLEGPWGSQTREVRGGESYGVSHSLTRHFGLGAADTIDTMTVTWPSGAIDVLEDVAADQTVEFYEGCATEFFLDADGDGFGDPAGDAVVACIRPANRADNDNDCDDADGNNHPGNAEVCDEADNNCNDEADEDLEDCAPTGGSSGSDSGGGSETTTGDSSQGSTTAPGLTTSPSGDDTQSDGDTGNNSDTATGGPGISTTAPDPSGADTDTGSGGDGGGATDTGGCRVDSPREGAFFLMVLLALGGASLRRRAAGHDLRA